MTTHRTANGKLVDMNALRAKNEHVRAVTIGEKISVNTKGDTIDSFGNVIEPVTNKVNKAYINTTNRGVNK